MKMLSPNELRSLVEKFASRLIESVRCSALFGSIQRQREEWLGDAVEDLGERSASAEAAIGCL